MTTLILSAALLLLYSLGCVLSKEYTDAIEESTQDYLPRPVYWAFVLSWPYVVTKTLFSKETDSE